MLQLEKQKNSRIQGNIGLATAILWFEQQGYRVYLPLTDSQEDDLAVKIDGRFHSVQVRTTYCQPKPERYQLNLRVMGGIVRAKAKSSILTLVKWIFFLP
jgi:hypothetical protein